MSSHRNIDRERAIELAIAARQAGESTPLLDLAKSIDNFITGQDQPADAGPEKDTEAEKDDGAPRTFFKTFTAEDGILPTSAVVSFLDEVFNEIDSHLKNKEK
jgi:hypothetical protein